eukprot:TRINITY_DN14153_c0_g1_i1.p1 TRINITY_DN14153_c0_g1~~TRINITY_DN14153_c0_g1_i1.p1  ORF type:complete len:176 (+),score=30.61 TRINITY_DN14153_c0_g1_i1:42-569(+)
MEDGIFELELEPSSPQRFAQKPALSPSYSKVESTILRFEQEEDEPDGLIDTQHNSENDTISKDPSEVPEQHHDVVPANPHVLSQSVQNYHKLKMKYFLALNRTTVQQLGVLDERKRQIHISQSYQPNLSSPIPINSTLPKYVEKIETEFKPPHEVVNRSPFSIYQKRKRATSSPR